MPFDGGQTPLLYDWSGAPVASGYAPITGRPGQALNTTAQGGMLALGADANSIARAPRIDANGTAYVTTASPAGGAAMVYTGQAPPNAASQYGQLVFMRQDMPSPAAYQPLVADMNGNLNTHAKSKQTFRAIMRGVTAAQNKYLAVLLNSSSGTMVLRLTVVMVYVTPPGVSGALLGQGSTVYYPFILELYRVQASNVSGGTAVTPAPCDTSDTLSAGVSMLQTPTISAYTASLFRQDAVAVVQSGEAFYQRDDPNNKSIVIRPGEGIALISLTSTIGTASGGTTTATPDLQFVFTQAPA